jgi:hypothetical protein
VLGIVFPAYFAGLLATTVVMWLLVEADADAPDGGGKITPMWITSGLGGLVGLFLLVLAMISGQAYQLATAGVLVGQYMLCMIFVVKSWRDSEPGAASSSGNLSK